MNFLECIERIEKLDFLIRIEKTGTPNDLAKKLNLSERHLYRLIELMKNLGAEIVYCRYKQSYKYKKPIKFKFGFVELAMSETQ